MNRSPIVRKAPDTTPKFRTRKCALKTCRAVFSPWSMTQKCCTPACAELWVAADRERKEKQARRVGLKKHERKAKKVARAQKAINEYVRLRDVDLPCICCDEWADNDSLTGGGWDAGHYLSRGSHPHLRFDERNIFKQRKSCNRPGGATEAAFREGVIRRIGLEAVEALKADNTPRHYTADDLEAIEQHYKAKIKALKAERK